MANNKTTNKNTYKEKSKATYRKQIPLTKNVLAQALKILKYWDRYLDKWVPVTAAWHVLRLRLEEWLPIWRVAANTFNKQSWTADK
jgi:hypothetical protein